MINLFYLTELLDRFFLFSLMRNLQDFYFFIKNTDIFWRSFRFCFLKNFNLGGKWILKLQNFFLKKKLTSINTHEIAQNPGVTFEYYFFTSKDSSVTKTDPQASRERVDEFFYTVSCQICIPSRNFLLFEITSQPASFYHNKNN